MNSDRDIDADDGGSPPGVVEALFGGLMDFRSGPTSGQQAERLQSAIGWLRNEFLTRVNDYLTPEQLTVWNGYRSSADAAAGRAEGRDGRLRSVPSRREHVRINNNRFTAEDVQFQGGGERSRATSETASTRTSTAGTTAATRGRRSSSGAAPARGTAPCRASSKTMR